MYKKSTEIFHANVLLVDDKKENLYALEKLLEEEADELNFIQTTSGYEALKLALNNEIALILMDVQMPGMDGYEVAKILKENFKTRNIPIIFVTALNHNLTYVIEGYNKGAVDYLFKPLDPLLTRAKVKSFIKLYQQQKELEQKNILLENLGLLVHNCVDIMCVLDDINLEIITANPAWETTLGYSPKEIIGRSFLDLISGNPEELKISLKEAYRSKKKLIEYENKLKCKNDDWCWLSWCFVYKNGQWFSSARNITSRKRAEDALTKANEELEQKVLGRTSDLQKMNQALYLEVEKRRNIEESLRVNNEKLKKTNANLDSFVYTASHDLKLPIANMEGLVQTLVEELPEEADIIKPILEMLGNSVKQLKETIHDLLGIIESQKEEEQDETFEVDCKQLLREIKLSIKDLIDSSKVEIIEDFEEKCCIKLTKPGLKSILYNLLTNAIKYRHSQRKALVVISIKTHGDCQVLKVRDNGLGMSKRGKERLFNMFERLHDHVEGSGIGLYIVKKTVEKYGGWIEVNSEEGVGTEFKIYFKN